MQTYSPHIRVLIVPFGHVPQRMTLMHHREEPQVFLTNKSYSRPPSHVPSSRHPRPGIIGVLKEPFFTKHPSLSHLASWDQVYTTTFLVLQRSRVEQSLEEDHEARVS
eukprot:scaffold12_cov368-Pavlova_lutheri.AAC.10